MKESIQSLFLAFVLLTVLVSGCAPLLTPTSVLPTSTETPTPLPPTSTDTPVPTATPTRPPTVTPTPPIEPPSITTEFLTDVKVLSHDSFDTISIGDYTYGWKWEGGKIGSIADGMFTLKGISFWESDLSPKGVFIPGDGIITKFKLQNVNGESTFNFDTGSWQTDSFRQFDITNTKRPGADLWQGKDYFGRYYVPGNLTLKSDTWYNILMAVGENSQFLAVIWEPANEMHRLVSKMTLGEKWSGKSWYFVVRLNEGETIYIDDFYRISFGEIIQ